MEHFLKMQETTDSLFDILNAYYTREINALLERTTDRENPQYGWLNEPLHYDQLSPIVISGFSFQPKPTQPDVVYFQVGQLKQIALKELPLDCLRALRSHLLKPDIRTDHRESIPAEFA